MRAISVIIYFTHKESLGHVSRILNIISAIKRAKSSSVKIFIFQAGKRLKYLTIPTGVSWFNLPLPYHSKSNFKRGSYLKVMPLSAQVRAKFMLSKIKEIQPDIFITEFFPFGRADSRFELFPILESLRKQKVRIFSSIGYPYLVQSNFKILSFYITFYEKILIHTPPNLEYNYFLSRIENPALKVIYHKVFNKLSPKISYTGYLLPHIVASQRPRDCVLTQKTRNNRSAEKMILVSRGGGVIYPKIILYSILASKMLPISYRFVVVSGPSTGIHEMKAFRGVMAKTRKGQVELYKYLPNLPLLVKDCDVSVSMCGYNTAAQLLYFRRPAVLIPSSVDPEIAIGYCSEQLSRADVLKRYLGSTVLDYKNLTVTKMAEAIFAQANRKSCGKGVENSWFGGDVCTVRTLFD